MKPPPFSSSLPDAAPARLRLLAWFDLHQRDLPWRRTTDPYRIWISEVMLQQTRVETVIPYYERFLGLFPSISDLAAASEEEVLAAWSGLGYYRRARLLHAAARVLSTEGRALPRAASELRQLPGFGAYTAAAVASIAFGEVVAVLDGNVIRVVCRLTAEGGDPRKRAVLRKLERAAAALLDATRPGDGNQALMELGATVCTPRQPRCEDCPLVPDCAAASAGTPEEFPLRRPPRPTLRVQRTVIVVERGEKVLLFRRPAERRVLAGTWELPFADDRDSEAGVAEALADRYGGDWTLGPVSGEVQHAITHRSFRVAVRHGTFEPPKEGAENPVTGWFRRAEMSGLPLSSLVGKSLDALETASRTPRPGGRRRPSCTN